MASAKKNAPAPAPEVEEGTPIDLTSDEDDAPIVAPEPAPVPADPEIARVSAALAPSELPVRKRKGGGAAVFVVDPSGKSGELHHDGKIYKPGAEVTLDAETAKALGKLVSPKE